MRWAYKYIFTNNRKVDAKQCLCAPPPNIERKRKQNSWVIFLHKRNGHIQII